MAASTDMSQDVLNSLQSLRDEVGRLSDRVAALEAQRDDDVDERVIMAIGAAVAAYLGVKARIRQIRLVSNPQWVALGRATIQTSHKLELRRSPL